MSMYVFFVVLVFDFMRGAKLELFGDPDDDSQGSSSQPLGQGKVQRLLTPHPLNRSLQGSRVKK